MPSSDGGEGPRRRASERRQNLALREVLDELIEISRRLSHHAAVMSPADLQYARERMEWLANEVWRHATGEDHPGMP